MDPQSTPAAAESTISDLFRLELDDGLAVESAGKVIRYKVVHLRETGVAHERKAIQQAERVMVVGGTPRLLVSDSDFRFAMTAQHIAAFECDGQRIPEALIDLATVGKLSSHDFGLIEQRVYLIELAAQVRYGRIKAEEFEALVRGDSAQADASPQPMGQAQNVGASDRAGESGPEMLADYAGRDPAGSAPSAAR